MFRATSMGGYGALNDIVKIGDLLKRPRIDFEGFSQMQDDLSEGAGSQYSDPATGHFRFVITLDDRLWMIEHSLDLGDGVWAEKLLAEYGPAIIATEDSDLVRRVGLSQERLLQIKEHEAKHGLYSLLKRESRWIRSQETFCKQNGLPSPYRVPIGD